MKRIVFTVNTYYPLNDGVQFVTQYHAEELAQKGYDVYVITSGSDNLEEETHNGVKIIRLNIKTKNTIYYGNKKEYRSLISSLVQNHGDTVLINVCAQSPFTDWCFPLMKHIKCLKVLYMHGMYDMKWHCWDISNPSVFVHKVWNNFRWGLYYLFTMRKFVKRYDKVVNLHEFDLGTIFFKKKYKIDSNIIQNAADDVFFQNSKEKKLNQKYIVNVSNYMPRKNQKKCLELFYSIENPNDYGLILIGSKKNNYYDNLIKIKKELEAKKGVRNVQILCDISRSETIDYIKDASIYLSTSKWEAYPISIVEAMACGVPFVSSNVGCIKFFPGGIVANSDSEFLYWLNILTAEDDVRETIGEAGKCFAQKTMTIANKSKELEEIINSYGKKRA